MKKKARLSIKGSYCGACTYAIEHAGRKLPGVSDVFVDIAKKEITVQYEGDGKILNEIIKMVDKLGHEACLIDQNVIETT
ncbi:MAG: heavy-metal-associated domain-containing protein [Candidatus Delongbacteria bacterium]|nr:heavy-metal-associated domain-containing protein [Candidatus Delongbacteria bacterium]